MPKQIDGKDLTYIEFPETWYCESQQELAALPASIPEGSLAEVLSATELKVFMKRSSGDWIEL